MQQELGYPDQKQIYGQKKFCEIEAFLFQDFAGTL
jgi:hypothetical protein